MTGRGLVDRGDGASAAAVGVHARMMRPGLAVERVHLCQAPVDFRKSIDGLTLLVEQGLALNPFATKSLHVFVNRQRDKVKILYWERNGFCLWYKRLESQRFHWPSQTTAETVSVSAQELNWLLDGFDIWRQSPHRELQLASSG